MKNKIKKQINSSFLTNHDLIQEIRNKSFIATRQNSSRLHTNPSKVSLIKKKSYERIATLQENNSMIANITISNFTPTIADKTILLIQDCMKSLGQTSQKIFNKLKTIISYVREMQTAYVKELQQRKRHNKQQQTTLIMRVDQINHQKTLVKKQNQDLKRKIKECQQKIEGLSINQVFTTTKSSSNLQQIIINQSEVINKQCQENQHQNAQLRLMLKTQALHIEDIIKNAPLKNKLKNYLSPNLACVNIRG